MSLVIDMRSDRPRSRVQLAAPLAAVIAMSPVAIAQPLQAEETKFGALSNAVETCFFVIEHPEVARAKASENGWLDDSDNAAPAYKETGNGAFRRGSFGMVFMSKSSNFGQSNHLPVSICEFSFTEKFDTPDIVTFMADRYNAKAVATAPKDARLSEENLFKIGSNVVSIAKIDKTAGYFRGLVIPQPRVD